MERFRPHLRRHRVTEQQWRVLRALSATGEVTAGSLASVTLISAPSLSRIIRDLLRRRLLVRRITPEDRRNTLISLSTQGVDLLDRAGPESEACYQAIGAAIGRERLGQLYQLLAEVETRLTPSPPAQPKRGAAASVR